MADLRELYQEIIIDHNTKPRNFRKLEEPTCSGDGYNPLCGDQVILYLKIEDEAIAGIGFQGSGCAISRASASLMTESIKGRNRREAEGLFTLFQQMITRPPGAAFDEEALGDLAALSGVSQYPNRIKCATLAWHTLRAALREQKEAVTTEKPPSSPLGG